MIYYIARRNRANTIETFVDNWAPDLQPLLRIVDLETLPHLKRAEPGIYIFSDFERMRLGERQLTIRLRNRIADQPGFVIFNDPAHAMARYELLHTLHERGLNPFNVYRWSLGPLPKCRFPVFVRTAHGHRGARSPLLHNRRQLALTLCRARLHYKNILIVEYAEVDRPDGIYRKYGAMRFGEHVYPRHLMFSDHWMIKEPDLQDTAKLEEETRFHDEAPDMDKIKAIFDIAGLNFGRIDYGYVDGRLAVWEINSNPHIVGRSKNIHGMRMPLHKRFAHHTADLFRDTIGAWRAERGETVEVSNGRDTALNTAMWVSNHLHRSPKPVSA